MPGAGATSRGLARTSGVARWVRSAGQRLQAAAAEAAGWQAPAGAWRSPPVADSRPAVARQIPASLSPPGKSAREVRRAGREPPALAHSPPALLAHPRLRREGGRGREPGPASALGKGSAMVLAWERESRPSASWAQRPPARVGASAPHHPRSVWPPGPRRPSSPGRRSHRCRARIQRAQSCRRSSILPWWGSSCPASGGLAAVADSWRAGGGGVTGYCRGPASGG